MRSQLQREIFTFYMKNSCRANGKLIKMRGSIRRLGARSGLTRAHDYTKKQTFGKEKLKKWSFSSCICENTHAFLQLSYFSFTKHFKISLNVSPFRRCNFTFTHFSPPQPTSACKLHIIGSCAAAGVECSELKEWICINPRYDR